MLKNSRRFVVHPCVDLDAVVSLAILGAGPEEIFFVPAGASELPAELAGARVVDHPLGEKGRLDPDGVRHAAACSLPEAAGASPELLAETDEQDSTGLVREPRLSYARIFQAVKVAAGEDPIIPRDDREYDSADFYEEDPTGMMRSARISLASVLAAVKAAVSVGGLKGETLDRAVYTVFRQIVSGLNLLHKEGVRTSLPSKFYPSTRLILDGMAILSKRMDAAREMIRTKGVRIEDVGGGLKVALLQGEQPPQVGLVLNEDLGCSLQVYSEGHNLGVFRYPGRNVPDLRRLAEKLPRWFVHSAGFLACWGSKKSPATTPPPAGTPQTPGELLKILWEILGPPSEGCSFCRREPEFEGLPECGPCVSLREEEMRDAQSDAEAARRI